MIKTVAEMIERLQMMPQGAKPNISYSVVDEDDRKDDYEDDIDCVELSNGEVYIGEHHEVVRPTPQLTEEERDKLIEERSVKTDQLIASLGMRNVPKD